jgi:glycosyltransferase involved in cell wall biosynthesis
VEALEAMKALVIAPQPFFTPRGTPFSVYHRTRISAELGVEIDLLAYGEGEDVELPGVNIIRIPRVRYFEPIPVGPSFGKLVLDIIMVFWTLGLLLSRRYDVVQAHEEAAFFSAFLKPFFGYKFIYDMHSRLPRQLVNFGFTDSPEIISVFERMELAALERADAVITISPALGRYAMARMGRPDRHFLIENTLLDPVRLRTRTASEHQAVVVDPLPAARAIVAYAGTLETYQGIDLLLEAHARVLQCQPGVLLLLVGGTPEKVQHYRDMAERLGILGACHFTGLLPQSMARDLLESATVVVSPRTEGDNTPLKVYEQLNCGIPLVATRVPSHTQVLSDEVCILADPDPEAFARAILEGLSNVRRRNEVVAAARELFDTHYSREAYIEKVSQVFGVLT